MSVKEVSLYFLGGVPIQYFRLDPIDPQSSFFLTQKLLLVRVLKPNNPFQVIHVSLLRSIFQDTCLMRGPNSLYMTPKLPRPRSLWSSFMPHPALNHGRGAWSHATRIRIRLPQMVTFDCEVLNWSDISSDYSSSSCCCLYRVGWICDAGLWQNLQ